MHRVVCDKQNKENYTMRTYITLETGYLECNNTPNSSGKILENFFTNGSVSKKEEVTQHTSIQLSSTAIVARVCDVDVERHGVQFYPELSSCDDKRSLHLRQVSSSLNGVLQIIRWRCGENRPVRYVYGICCSTSQNHGSVSSINENLTSHG